MMPVNKRLAGTLALAVALGACAPAASIGPTVAAAPGPDKPPDVFGADDTACRLDAQAQAASTTAASTPQTAGNVIYGTALGGDLGATLAGGPTQQQYDISYAQCMTARGNIVPGVSFRLPAGSPGAAIPP
jgi:hypothetical protein